MKKKHVGIFVWMLFIILFQTQVLGVNLNAKIKTNKQEIKQGEDITISIRFRGI